ncbi:MULTISPECIES: ABC transporter permease [Shouchella]|uniref:ABC transporter permease n=1 Tax=Shouchella hunanensis TaxID=766894 RepID=A0ABY7W1V1_9BACI|nr:MULTISPECIES: ABC transporter permease [Shouchella]WDF02541.1 ABC transporter permease [Shouchella hunanensis]GAF20856.1 ABC transporter, permease protein [Bacillus sp. JCM 19047]
MTAIFYQYTKEIIRSPFTLLLMIGMTVFFTLIMSSAGSSHIHVTVYSDSLGEDVLNERVSLLNRNYEEYVFEATSKQEANRLLSAQGVEAVVELKASSYVIHSAFENAPLMYMVQPVLESHYLLHYVEQVGTAETNDDVFAFESQAMEQKTKVDEQLRSLFGFTLFFSFFTMGFTILTILELKEDGVWNRLILTSTTKTELYLSNLLVAFMLSFAQITIVLVLFATVFNVDFYGGFWSLFLVMVPYLFATMAFGIFMSGIVTSSQQLTAVIPLFGTSFAMLGGVFWPLDIVDSEWMLALSYGSPLRYGLEMMAGATYGNWSIDEFLFPSAVLIFMGLAFTGIGIRLMERKSV